MLRNYEVVKREVLTKGQSVYRLIVEKRYENGVEQSFYNLTDEKGNSVFPCTCTRLEFMENGLIKVKNRLGFIGIFDLR